MGKKWSEEVTTWGLKQDSFSEPYMGTGGPFVDMDHYLELESRAEKAEAELAHTVLSLKESTKLYENMRRAFIDSHQSHEEKNITIAALKEKHRWRKWPEERPPESATLEIVRKGYNLPMHGHFAGDITWNNMRVTHWREIVGPEE